WIARRTWQPDAMQRIKEHLAIWFMRVMIGAKWFQRSLLENCHSPSPADLRGGQALAENAAIELHRWVAKHVVIPLLPVINPLVFLAKLSCRWRVVRPIGVIGSCSSRTFGWEFTHTRGEWLFREATRAPNLNRGRRDMHGPQRR